jgi:hypothetical protein
LKSCVVRFRNIEFQPQLYLPFYYLCIIKLAFVDLIEW